MAGGGGVGIVADGPFLALTPPIARHVRDGYAWGVRRAALVAWLLLAAVLAAACGSGTPSSGSADTPGASIAPSAAPADTGGTGSAGPSSTEPSGSAASPASPSAAPTVTPKPSVATPSAGPSSTVTASAGTGTADACTGSADNRSFYANLAASVSWDVYCAVLPKGWVVDSGRYRLANGGWLKISYKGPGGATLSLSEGAFCTDSSGCVPPGSDAGDAALGALPGTIVDLNGGGYAIVSAAGQTLSWLMVTSGLDQATTASFGAALAHVSS